MLFPYYHLRQIDEALALKLGAGVVEPHAALSFSQSLAYRAPFYDEGGSHVGTLSVYVDFPDLERLTPDEGAELVLELLRAKHAEQLGALQRATARLKIT